MTILFHSENTRKKGRKGSKSPAAIVLLLSLLCPSLVSAHTYNGPRPIWPIPRSTDTVVVESQLQQVADSFEIVLEAMSQSLDNDIPIDPLLEACHTLLAVMQKTGPKAVARDFDNNLRKIESLHHPIKTRTVTSLLELERDSGVHRTGNASSVYLNDKSGAMGLLWIRRTLAFQTDFYEQLLAGSEPLDAIHHAYQRQLKPYHGWAMTKCYNLLVGNKVPPRRLLLARVGGYCEHQEHDEKYQQHEQKTLEDLKRLVASWHPLIQHWKHSFVELGMEDTSRV